MTTVSSDSANPVSSRFGWSDLLTRLGPLIGLLFVLVLFSILEPQKFLRLNNFELILRQTAVVGTAALGMTLIIISGGIDLSVGSAIALHTVVIALLLRGGIPALGAATGGIIVAALCGCLIGLLITRLKLAPFIITLGMWGSLRGTAKGLADNSMVYPPGTFLNELLRPLSPDHIWLLTPGAWMMLLLAVLVAAMLRYTRFGRHIFAIGSNEQTARLCGINVEWTKLRIYMLAAALAGVAGLLQFSYLTMGDPTTATGMELDVIAAVVIGGASLSGGQGSILGSLVGALIMTIVSNGCTKMELDNWVQEIVTGGIIILAVTLDRLRHRRTV
ncbi:MAG: ABC transporter permease [Sedimentisphaerales bacterium]|nr:ABC transporter permease [Sedimentisphaerales bacterium]